MGETIRLENLKDIVGFEIDLFICSSSFEERCFSVPNQIGEIGSRHSIVFFNSNEYAEIQKNAEKLVQVIGQANERSVELVPLNTDTQIQNAIKINDTLDAALDNRLNSIVVDTTTFTHETLLIVIGLLNFKRAKFDKLSVTYVGAEDYSTNEKNLSDKWLSTGIEEVRTIMGYPGLMSPARPNHLVILFGFESERTKKLIEHLEFDMISLGFGKKEASIGSNHYDLNSERHKQLMEVYSNATEFELCLTDPFKAKEDILNHLKGFTNSNNVIVPMNNKLSTIGAALVAFENPKVQLIYAKAVKYNVDGYSTPRNDVYVYQL